MDDDEFFRHFTPGNLYATSTSLTLLPLGDHLATLPIARDERVLSTVRS